LAEKKILEDIVKALILVAEEGSIGTYCVRIGRGSQCLNYNLYTLLGARDSVSG
jgi:hypothetical protein